MSMLEILKNAVEKGASDIHIATSTKPMARITGDIVALDFPLSLSRSFTEMNC